MLDVAGLTIAYEGVTAVRGVDLHVDPGTTVALLGPSGSGKSSILRAVAGLEPPLTGRVSVNGADVTDLPPERRGVGLMFQDYALFPHRDVGANVGFGVRMAGADRRAVAARVGEVLELVGLTGYERRAVSSLSGGEQQQRRPGSGARAGAGRAAPRRASSARSTGHCGSTWPSSCGRSSPRWGRRS